LPTALRYKTGVMRKLTGILLLASALLSSCSEEPAVTQPEDDPALGGALAEPILVDPDLPRALTRCAWSAGPAG
jgi:hypothetical protein